MKSEDVWRPHFTLIFCLRLVGGRRKVGGWSWRLLHSLTLVGCSRLHSLFSSPNFFPPASLSSPCAIAGACQACQAARYYQVLPGIARLPGIASRHRSRCRRHLAAFVCQKAPVCVDKQIRALVLSQTDSLFGIPPSSLLGLAWRQKTSEQGALC